MKPFLHLSIRDHDDAVAKEFDAIASFGGLKPGQLVQLRVEQAPLPVIRPDDYSGIVIGGGQFNTSDAVKTDTQRRVEADGLSIIRSLVGHGVGREMHEDPQVPNYGEPGRGPLLEPGMVFAVEPMVNAGGPEVRVGDDNWAVYSADGSLAAHFEFTVAVTEEGPRILTPWHLD